MIDELFVDINEKNKKYPIFITNDCFQDLRTMLLEKIECDKFLVVIDKNVDRLYKQFLGFDKSEKLVLKDGEKYKNFKTYQKILNKAFEKKLTRKSAIFAIGGGVVGDIAGFAASTYMRGIKYIQVPTTLLADVDSSVGGKTAIDTKFGKNLIGTFYQPDFVYINTNFIKTLSQKQFMSGLGEILKYAFIEKSCNTNEYGLMDFLAVNNRNILNRDLKFLQKIIRICLKLKTAVVSQDEKEQNLRKILNFGHTMGHALENYTKYRIFTHGEAIAYGMKFAFNIAVRDKLITEQYREIAFSLFDMFNFQNEKLNYPLENLIEIMKMDKKCSNNELTFILPTEKGIVIEKNIEL